MWAQRCTHEASRWATNSFLTLTYDDEHLPTYEETSPNGHRSQVAILQPADLQKFLKRLRILADRDHDAVRRDTNAGLKFFACGEYGETTGRPHYHALIFNGGFPDQRRAGRDLYESEILNKLWGHGGARIGDVTPASAAYIAQYNIKKQGQGDADPDGVWRPAPFLRMSTRPAIGLDWARTYATDLIKGYITADGRKRPIPRYYREKIKEEQPHIHEHIEAARDAARNRMAHYDERERHLRETEKIHKRRRELTTKPRNTNA